MPMTEQQWKAFARRLHGALTHVVPDWTNHNTHDPGITVLEAVNYALTDLQFRSPLDDRASVLARGIAGQAAVLANRYDAHLQRRSDPYRNFKFRVQWDGRYVAGISKVSALKRTTSVVEYREGSDPAATRKLPGPTQYEAITLERGISRDREFEAWANATGGGGAGSPQLVPKDLFIELYDEAGQLALSYKVWGCWVSQYQALPELDADGGGMLIETLRLECDGWERVDAG